MLKRFLFTGFFNIFFAISFSQTISSQRKEDMNIEKFHNAPVYINSPEDFVSIPIHSISIVDARPDSSAIGLYQLFDLQPSFIATSGSFRAKSEQYIKKYVHCSISDSFSVVMVFKKFWISTDAHKLDSLKLQDIEDDTSRGLNVNLFANIEFYLFKDSSYYALYRFDSVFSAHIKAPINIARDEQNSYAALMVRDALETSLSKLSTINREWNTIVSSKRKFIWHDIESHEHQMFEIPVLKDASLVPGVYMTFEEFKSNSPSITEFEITKDKFNDFIYVKQSDGRQKSLMNVWGYCDSSNQVFVQSNHNYFKLQRRQNAFYIYGSNQTLHETKYFKRGIPLINNNSLPPLPLVPATNDIIPQLLDLPINNDPPLSAISKFDKYSMVLKPFQLDWDTGKLY